MARAWVLVLATALGAACASFGTDDSASTTSADAGTSDGGDAGRFCERYAAGNGTPAYCRDFDDGTDVLFDWDDKAISALGSVTLGGIANSPPNSMKTRLEANAAGCSYARVVRAVDVPQSRIHLEFAVRVGGDGTSGPLGSSFVVEEFGTCRLILSSTDSSGVVHEQAPNKDINHGLSRFPKDKTWAHVEVDVDRTTRALAVRVDGAPAFTSEQALDQACDLSGTQIRLLLGQYCEATAATPREVHIDDVVLTGR